VRCTLVRYTPKVHAYETPAHYYFSCSLAQTVYTSYEAVSITLRLCPKVISQTGSWWSRSDITYILRTCKTDSLGRAGEAQATRL
jgi:hypothetical protein